MSAIGILTVGEIAKRAGVKVQTLHYYEKVGILKPAYRLESGYRAYDLNAVRVIRFIKHAQELGFSLEEIHALLKLRSNSGPKCESVRKKAQIHLRDVNAKIARLEHIRDALGGLVKRCEKKKSDTECPILDVLDRES